ncbi:MAG: hypothetical protein CMJ27_03460 [Phycisphaerae bacterium]|nr:hypothetical protein [Phycisphaerae bacterium]
MDEHGLPRDLEDRGPLWSNGRGDPAAPGTAVLEDSRQGSDGRVLRRVRSLRRPIRDLEYYDGAGFRSLGDGSSTIIGGSIRSIRRVCPRGSLLGF